MTSSFDRRSFLGSALSFGAIGALPGAVLAASAASENAAAKGAPFTVRFVNLDTLLGAWDYAKQTQDAFNAEYRARAEAMDRREGELAKKLEEVRQFARQNQKEEAKRLNKEAVATRAQIQFEQEDMKREKEERFYRLYLSVYQQIQDVVGKWAAANGVSCVLTMQDEVSADEDIGERYRRTVLRQVLWHTKDLDATSEVLTMLQATQPVTIPQNTATSSAPATPAKK